MAVLPARLSVLNSMSQSTGLFAKEGDIVTIVNLDRDQLLASVDVADIAQCEGGYINLQEAFDAISRSGIKLEEILTQEPMQDADRRCYVLVLVQGVELEQ
jgi:hypothetical protein